MEQDYDVICRLGEGSFGTVYKARHRRTADEVAVKQIKIGTRSWDEACRSTELQALKALRHPFIVRLKELIRSQWDGSLYYIFEFLDSDLCRLLKDFPGGLEEMRAAELTRQHFAGLAHMHQHNFFHRDIKPENILLDVTTETIRIADLGQARSLRARPPFTDYVGTRWYRAPECLLRDRTYSSPVDIWASGLIFAELLRGSPMFCGTSTIDQLYKIFTVLGHPLHDWPDFAKLASALRFRVPDRNGCGISRVLPANISPQCHTFLAEMLSINPRRRPFARKCLENSYFSQLPPLDLDRMDTHRSRTSTKHLYETDKMMEDRSPRGIIANSTRTLSALTNTLAETATDLDLDAELDAILGDGGGASSSAPPGGYSFAGALRDEALSPSILPQRAENDDSAPPTLPGGAFGRSASPPNLALDPPKPDAVSRGSSFEFMPTSRPRAEESRSNSSVPAPQTPQPVVPAVSLGAVPRSPGAVSVDALLDSLCADFPPSPERCSKSPQPCYSPAAPEPLPPSPPSGLLVEHPPPPVNELLPLTLSMTESMLSAVAVMPPASNSLPLSTEETTPCAAMATVEQTSAPTGGSIASLMLMRDEDVSPAPAAPTHLEAPLRLYTSPELRPVLLGSHVSSQSRLVVEAPATEVAWAGTPSQASQAGEVSSEGSPQWQPSARREGASRIADWRQAPQLPDSPGSCSSKPDSEVEVIPDWRQASQLPDSPGACSSKPDSEVEVILPGLTCAPPAANMALSEASATFSCGALVPAGGATKTDAIEAAASGIVVDRPDLHRNRSIASAWSNDADAGKLDQEESTAVAETLADAEHTLSTEEEEDEPAEDACEEAGFSCALSIAQPTLPGKDSALGLPQHKSEVVQPNAQEPVVVAQHAESEELSELAALRAENAALRERLAAGVPDGAHPSVAGLSPSAPSELAAAPSASSSSAPQALENSAAPAASGAMPSPGLARPPTKLRGGLWASDEAGQLRRLVKRIIRKGAQDRDTLWAEVSSELGNGRTARECKLQYARDYRAHKAKNAGMAQELGGDSVGATAASSFNRSSASEVLSRTTGSGQSRGLRLQSLPEPLSHSGAVSAVLS